MGLIQLAIFASGGGSNAIRIIEYFNNHQSIRVGLLFCNKQDAPIVELAKQKGINVHVCTNEQAADGNYIKTVLQRHNINYIALAGYLRMIPAELISAFPERIINIHPSLLPKYGGKGMYGMNVHNAVAKEKEKESGITIHFVNEEFDKGRIIAQFSCELDPSDSPEIIQEKVQQLEHLHFAPTIEKTLLI